MSVTVANTTAALSGKTLDLLESDQTITGLKTFDRDPSAPFAVSASSAKVTNLDADLLDGQEGTYYTNADNLASGTVAIARGGTGAASTSQNYVFAGPTSGSGAPAFRALVAADIPSTLTVYRASVYNSGTQAVTSSGTALTFDSEEFDATALHDTGSNTSRLTIPGDGAGVYVLSAHCEVASVGTSTFYIALRKDGSTYLAGTKVQATGGSLASVDVTTVVSLANSAYVEVICIKGDSSSWTTGHASALESQNRFSIYRIS